MRKFLFKRISGEGISYKNSSLTIQYSKFSSCKAGEKIPFSLRKLLPHIDGCIHFSLIIFKRIGQFESYSKLAGLFSKNVKCVILPYKNHKSIFRNLQVNKTGFILVRPDGHIACTGTQVSDLNNYLHQFLIPDKWNQ
ncbi:MAG: hypothetical protein HC906_00380 [Bacteroidales bacterium]|nr:hypothetical protein [Bacteroidales bacterium]